MGVFPPHWKQIVCILLLFMQAWGDKENVETEQQKAIKKYVLTHHALPIAQIDNFYYEHTQINLGIGSWEDIEEFISSSKNDPTILTSLIQNYPKLVPTVSNLYWTSISINNLLLSFQNKDLPPDCEITDLSTALETFYNSHVSPPDNVRQKRDVNNAEIESFIGEILSWPNLDQGTRDLFKRNWATIKENGDVFALVMIASRIWISPREINLLENMTKVQLKRKLDIYFKNNDFLNSSLN
jgi:hypothetical protein